MILIFECDDCRLSFAVGGYIGSGIGTGYLGELLLVCLGCGTRAAIRRAIPNKERYPELRFLHDISVTSVPQESRVAFMKFMRSKKKLSVQDAKAIVDNLPVVVQKVASQEETDSLLESLSAIGIDAQTVVSGKVKHSFYGPQMKDQLISAPGPREAGNTADKESWKLVTIRGPVVGSSGEMDLAAQQCPYCNAIGKYVNMIPKGYDKCPRCRSNGLHYREGCVM